MTNLPLDLSVSQARDRFSETVNRAAFGGQGAVAHLTQPSSLAAGPARTAMP
jgi:hypothetical protein